MYFAQGSVSLQGVVLPAGYTVDIAKHPTAQDYPGQDVTLTGNNVWSRDPRAPYPYYVETGPFKPYGVPATKGEVVKGEEQERKAEQMFALIGRSPAKARQLGGSVMAKGREAIADIQGLLGGAESGWRDLHQLLLADVNAMGAFAIAEQLGLALGLPEIVEIAFPVVQELSTAQLLLQEFLLEMAPLAILSGEQP